MLEFLDQSLLDILGLIVDQHKDTAKDFLLLVGGELGLRVLLGLDALNKLANDCLVQLILHHACLLRVYFLQNFLLLHWRQLDSNGFDERDELRLRDDANPFLIDLIEVLFQLTFHHLRRDSGGLHDLYQPFLIAEQLRMDVHKLHLLYLRDFSQDIVLPDVLYSGAFIGRAEIKDRFPDQKLLGERIIDPFLRKASVTSIYCCLMVLLGE